MLTITGALVVAAGILTLVSAAGKVPLWPAVLCLVIVEALQLFPR